MENLSNIYKSILNGNMPQTENFTRRALGEEIAHEKIISQMNSAMEEVGNLFSKNELFLPEMMIAARAMMAGMRVLEPYIIGEQHSYKGKILMGTIKGDLHDVGKNLVSMLFRGAGYEIVDIGVDVSKEKILEAIQKESPHFVGISALLTTALPNLQEAIDFLKKSLDGSTCKIIIGGAPVTEQFAKENGADGYAEDAGKAVQVVKALRQKA